MSWPAIWGSGTVGLSPGMVAAILGPGVTWLGLGLGSVWPGLVSGPVEGKLKA